MALWYVAGPIGSAALGHHHPAVALQGHPVDEEVGQDRVHNNLYDKEYPVYVKRDPPYGGVIAITTRNVSCQIHFTLLRLK